MFRHRRPRALLRSFALPMMPPPQPRHAQPRRPMVEEVERLLRSANPADRLKAIDLLALRPHHPRAQAALSQLAELDSDPTVRETARATLQRHSARPLAWTCPACGASDITGATCPSCASTRPQSA